MLLAESGPSDQPVGRIIHTKGEVEVIRARENLQEKAKADTALYPRDVVLTGVHGRASILMADETLIQLNVRSRLVMEQVSASSAWIKLRKIVPAAYFGARSLYQMLAGQIWIRNKNKEAMVEIRSPALTVGIRGTELDLKVAEDGTVVLSVLEGLVKAWNEMGIVEVGAREQAVARPGVAPQKSS